MKRFWIVVMTFDAVAFVLDVANHLGEFYLLMSGCSFALAAFMLASVPHSPRPKTLISISTRIRNGSFVSEVTYKGKSETFHSQEELDEWIDALGLRADHDR